MQNTRKNVAICLVTAILGWGWSSSTWAQSPAHDVRAALDQLHQWLGTGENGQRWEVFLESKLLQAELEKGTAADLATVVRVRSRYSGSEKGLELPLFGAVSQALDNWLQELASDNPEQLGKLAVSAKGNFLAIPPERLTGAKQQLGAALAELDQFLRATGEPNAQAWHAYLLTDAVKAQLESDKPNAAKLQEPLARFTANEVGLELPVFLKTRAALREFADMAAYFAVGNMPQSYAETIDELTRRLDVYGKNPTTDEALAIGRLLGQLHRSSQAPFVVKALQRRYWQPNLFVAASSRLVGAGVNDDVNDKTPVQENILGTSIYGTAHTQGQVSLALVPDNAVAAFDIRMVGVTNTQSTGYNGPVTVFSHSTSELNAAKRVMFDMDGLRSAPAVANVNSNSVIDGISARCRLIEKIAWKKAGQSKGQADQIARGIAQRKLSSRVDEQSAGTLKDANARFFEKVIHPARRRDMYPRQANFSTTAEQLHVQLMHVTESQLAAPTAPPPAASGYDMALRLHESIVGNYSESILGGMTLTDERLEKLVKDATGNVPEELQVTADKDPWSITFAPDQPISVRLDGDEMTISIRGLKFTRNEQELKMNVKISGAYTMQKTATGSKFTRKGDVDVEYVNQKGTLTVAQIAFKTFLRRKFEAMLKPEFVSEGIQLKGRWARAGKLVVQTFNTSKGWATANWNLVPVDVAEIKSADTAFPSFDVLASLLELE